MFIRILLGIISAAALAVSVSAQDKPVRVRGTIEQVEGAMLTVKARGGETLKILAA